MHCCIFENEEILFLASYQDCKSLSGYHDASFEVLIFLTVDYKLNILFQVDNNLMCVYRNLVTYVY